MRQIIYRPAPSERALISLQERIENARTQHGEAAATFLAARALTIIDAALRRLTNDKETQQ